MLSKKFSLLEFLIEKYYKNKKFEQALRLLSAYGNAAYVYNQWYVNDRLEEIIKGIEIEISAGGSFERVNKETVLFYDGFYGVDTRGLCLIYLKALIKLNYRIVYVTHSRGRAIKQTTKELLTTGKAKIKYIQTALGNHIETYREICSIFLEERPAHAFFYTFPNDVSAEMAFLHFEGKVRRYLINLTDHAFWFGVNALDYCIEFRNYGAGVSYFFRNIPQDKLVIQPYYPFATENYAFEGFPFKKGESDFIVFSGGSVYKTIDGEGTYYKIVEKILMHNKRVKFWYAGDMLCSDLKVLMEKYPGRFFFTRERKDLLPLLHTVDMYLSTYPILGGLMSQYAAMSGKFPFSLMVDEAQKGILLNDDEGILYEDEDVMLKDIFCYIDDSCYREEKNAVMQNSVITEEEFTSNLSQVMCKGLSGYPVKLKKYDTKKFLSVYLKMADKHLIEKNLISRENLNLFLVQEIPVAYFKGLFWKIVGKWKD